MAIRELAVIGVGFVPPAYRTDASVRRTFNSATAPQAADTGVTVAVDDRWYSSTVINPPIPPTGGGGGTVPSGPMTWTAAFTDNGDGTWSSTAVTDNGDGTWTGVTQ